MEDESPKSPKSPTTPKCPKDPKDEPKGFKNICYYEDEMDKLTGSDSCSLNERIENLEVIVARLLRFMPQLGKPD
jgi:hypothetical protein